MIARPGEIEIEVSANQSDAESIREYIGKSVTVLFGEGTQTSGVIEAIEPRGSDILNQPLLAAVYGGPINVILESSESKTETMRLLAPRFQVKIRMDASQHAMPVALTPGQMAWVRIPGSQANLWNAVSRWFEKKWTEIENSADQSQRFGGTNRPKADSSTKIPTVFRQSAIMTCPEQGFPHIK